MSKASTHKRVASVMPEGSTVVAEIAGPNQSELEFWNVGGQIVIVQYWPEGGCSHFVPGQGNSWVMFEIQMREFVQPRGGSG